MTIIYIKDNKYFLLIFVFKRKKIKLIKSDSNSSNVNANAAHDGSFSSLCELWSLIPTAVSSIKSFTFSCMPPSLFIATTIYGLVKDQYPYPIYIYIYYHPISKDRLLVFMLARIILLKISGLSINLLPSHKRDDDRRNILSYNKFEVQVTPIYLKIAKGSLFRIYITFT